MPKQTFGLSPVERTQAETRPEGADGDLQVPFSVAEFVGEHPDSHLLLGSPTEEGGGSRGPRYHSLRDRRACAVP